ncbi:hypothetical protein Dxin01_02771 [Deinococcus xinjiangensis]|uniref:Secreted protein n=1 Tax=Deinococcus xinjiangensis TaxID=457454 RepID=A0ABP9VCR0_9DEIO
MSKPREGSPLLTVLLILGVLAALFWIFTIWAGRQYDPAAAARTQNQNASAETASLPAPASSEGPHEFSGIGDLKTDAQSFAGGRYTATADFGSTCRTSFLRLHPVAGGSSEGAGEAFGAGQQVTHLYGLAAGEYYIESNVSAVDCQWKVTLQPD